MSIKTGLFSEFLLYYYSGFWYYRSLLYCGKFLKKSGKNYQIKEVQCSSSAHHSVQLLIISLSSNSHIRRKQPQRTFLQKRCSVTMINVIKKILYRKIQELNTSSGSSNDSLSQAPNKHILKNRLLQNKSWWLVAASALLLSSACKAFVFSENSPLPSYFFHLKSFLWKGLLTVKVREKKSSIRFWATSVSVLKYVHI